MKKIYAVCRTLEAGYPGDREKVKRCGIQIGDKFEVAEISMGQSYTNVWLGGYENEPPFNSVFFNFVDANGNDYDIFNDPEFNPYL